MCHEAQFMTAARTTGSGGDESVDSAMIRHGRAQPGAAGAPPPATATRASMATVATDRVTTSRASGRLSRAEARGGRPCVPTSAPLSRDRAIAHIGAERNPHSHRPWPAGSYMGGFRTPTGTQIPSPFRPLKAWGGWRVRFPAVQAVGGDCRAKPAPGVSTHAFERAVFTKYSLSPSAKPQMRYLGLA